MSFIEPYLNLIIIGCLTLLLVYLINIRRKLENFKKAQASMQGNVDNFSKSTLEAKKAFEDLELAHQKLAESLKSDKIESNKLKEDLLFLVEQGKMIADRLESSLHALRPHSASSLISSETKASQDPSRPLDPPTSAKDKTNLKKLIENLR